MPLRAVLCADWSGKPGGREIYVAVVETRRVERVSPPVGGWTVAAALGVAREQGRGGSALLGFDAPLGVPSSFWHVIRRERPEWSRVRAFPELLVDLARESAFFEPVGRAADWRPVRPFFPVPPGAGGRRRFEQAMAARGVDGLRGIDRLAKGLPVFITAGIAGAVGGAASDVWRALGGLRAAGQPKLWPFDGSLDELSGGEGAMVAEIYPRLAYGVALADGSPPWARRSVAKGDPELRAQAVFSLAESGWVRAGGVRLDDLAVAIESGDAFDALFSVAAILRCLVEGAPLSRPELEEPTAEGGILCAGSLDFHAPERKFRTPPETGCAIVRIHAALREIEPPVWRRLEVPAGFTLPQLHAVLQIAFDWEDRHLHEFRFGDAAFGTPDPEASPELKDERKVSLDGLLEPGMTGEHVYDFGDDWVHELRIEAMGPEDPAVSYPVCTGGARACPPEDCGGVPGYAQLLESLLDPRHEEHDQSRTGVGGYFDPEGFDMNGVNRRLRGERGLRPRKS